MGHWVVQARCRVSAFAKPFAADAIILSWAGEKKQRKNQFHSGTENY